MAELGEVIPYPPSDTPTPDMTFDPSPPDPQLPSSSTPSVATMADPNVLSPAPLGGAGRFSRDEDSLPSLAGLIPTPEQQEEYRKKKEGLLNAQIAEREKYEKQEAEYDQNYRGKMDRLLAAESWTGDERPWDPNTMAPPPTSLWEKFGSPGFIFAMLAGNFSAMPMQSALFGGAAAMNAINQGDMDGYDKAYQTWKDNTNLAIKRHDQEHREFEDIMQLWEKDHALARQRLEEHLNKYGDYGKLALLQAGYDSDFFDAVKAKADAVASISKMQADMDAKHALIVGTRRYMRAGESADSAYNHALSDREEAKKPLEARRVTLSEWKAADDKTHKDIADRIKLGKLSLDEAKAEVDRVHKENMDAIASGRLSKDITAEQETERWHKAREALDQVKVEQAGRKIDLSEWKQRSDDENKKRLVAVQEGRLTIAEAHQQADEEHKQNMDAIAQDRFDASVTRDAETARWHQVREAIDKAKIEASKSKAPVSTETAKAVKDDLATALNRPLSPEEASTLDAALATKGGNPGKIVGAANTAVQEIKDRLKKGESEEKINPLKVINEAIGAASLTARSGPAMFVQSLIRKDPEKAKDPEYLKQQLALYKESQSAAGTLGTRAGAIEMSVEELKTFGDAAIEARERVGGFSITPFNDWQQVLNRSTGVEGQGELDVWTAEVLTAYATAISRGNQPTVTAQQRAIELLKGAYSVEAYTERVRTMQSAAAKIKQAQQSATKTLLGGEKPSAEQRFKELIAGGTLSKEDAYQIMHEEGY